MYPGEAQNTAHLVARLRTGDVSALGALYERYSRDIYRVGVLFFQNDADAEDLVHDVFAGLQRALGSYDERGLFWSWFRRVAVRTALMQLRAGRREREVLTERSTEVSRVENTPMVETKVDLATAIGTLPERHRIVFVLKEVEGMGHKEISGLLGISVGASKVRLFRAREILRARLDR